MKTLTWIKPASRTDAPLAILCAIALVVSCGHSAETIVDGIYTNAGNAFSVGDRTSFNSLVVTNQGWLENGVGTLGQNPGADDNSALVTGPNSFWENTSTLYIGHSGARNRLAITQGGRVKAALALVGFQLSSHSNSVAVQASLWECAGGLQLGLAGAGNQVVMSNGGRLHSGGLNCVGYSAPSSHNRFAASGPGTAWFNGGNLTVGSFGSASNRLEIAGGAQVYSLNGQIGIGTGNAVTVADPGSFWGNQGLLFVGRGGVRNSLDISAGGQVTCIGAVVAGQDNQMLLSGANSLCDTGGSTGQLVLGDPDSRGNSIIVRQGASLLSWAGLLTGTSNTLTVINPGSLWQNAQQLRIGQELSQANRLEISAGARVTTSTLSLGGDDGRILVAGSNTTLRAAGFLTVGDEAGSRNQLTVSNGGQLSSQIGYIGGFDTPFLPDQNDHNSVLISGPGSRWTNELDLTVGVTGPQSQLILSAGGELQSQNGWIGYHASSSRNSVVVSDPNTLWQNQGDLCVGRLGSANLLVVTNGATLRNANAWIGWKQNSENTVIVASPGSAWRNSGSLVVGDNSARNRLLVTNGSHVAAAAVSLGSTQFNPAFARSNSIVVAGPDSLLSSAGPLSVGANDSLNTLRIENGGTVQADSLVLGNSGVSFNNQLEVLNGALLITNRSGHGGLLLLRQASLTLSNASLVCGHLIATNGRSSLLQFQSGILQASRATLRTGRPFQVGQDLAPARLVLSENTLHAFPDGLSIASNGAFVAAGTITGSVTNAGQLHVAGDIGQLTVAGNLALTAPATLTFDIGGFNPGITYDTLGISNHLHSAGRLRLRLRPGFIPSSADLFTLLTFDSSSGSFQNAPHGARLAIENAAGSFLVELTSRTLRVRAFQSTNPPSYSVPEEWALRYFDHAPLSGDELLADPDEDGLSTYDEYVAGTSPIDPASVFKITAIRRNGSGHVVLQFPYSPDKSYAVSYSSNLTDWLLLDLSAPTPVPPGLGEWIDDGTFTGGLPPIGPAAQRSYRIAVR